MLRRKELCDENLCPDRPEDGGRCCKCPQDKLDAAQSTEKGMLLRRALDLAGALKLGVTMTLDEIPADEFYAALLIQEETDKFEKEKLPNGG